MNISFSQSTYTTHEKAGHVEVCVTLLIKLLDKPVHVLMSTIPGTAIGEVEGV